MDATDRQAAIQLLRKQQGSASAQPCVQSNGVPESSTSDRGDHQDAGMGGSACVAEGKELNMYILEATQLRVKREREERCRLFVAELRRQRLRDIRAMSKL